MGIRALLSLAFVASLSLLAACAPRSEIRSAQPLGQIAPPEFSVVDGQTSVERFDPPGAGGTVALRITTRVHNPNPFPVKLTGVEYTVHLEGQAVARGSLAPDAFLTVNGSVPLRFDIETELRDRPGLLRAVVRSFAGRPLRFRIEGNLVFNSLSHEFRSVRRTIVEGTTLAREAVLPPTLRLDEAASEIYLLRKDVPVVRLAIEASNPGDVGYFLFGKDLRLSLGGLQVATDDMRPTPVPARGSARIDVIFYPDGTALDGPATSMLQAALDGIPTSLRLEGELAMDVLGVDTFTVPEGWRVQGFIHAAR